MKAIIHTATGEHHFDNIKFVSIEKHFVVIMTEKFKQSFATKTVLRIEEIK